MRHPLNNALKGRHSEKKAHFLLLLCTMSSFSLPHQATSPDGSPLAHMDSAAFLTRRDFLTRNGIGFGGLSLAALFGINPFDLNAAAGMTGPPASVTFFMRKVKGPPGSSRRSTPIGSRGSFTMRASRRW